MKLISMTEFVLNVINSDRECNRGKMLDEIGNYANFLNQPLTLGMFVPCGEDGEVLKEPNEKDEQFYGAYGISNLNKAKNKFEAAKDRVLFEGFEVMKDFLFLKSEEESYEIMSIFSLIDFNLDDLSILLEGVQPMLTKSAIKKTIG